MFTDLNWLAIVVAAAVYWFSGALWYSPLILGKKFMALMGVGHKEMADAKKKGMAKQYVLSLVSSLITVLALALVMDLTLPADNQANLVLIFWLWLGFVVTSNLSGVLWEGRKSALFYIQMLWSLLALMLAGFILYTWN